MILQQVASMQQTASANTASSSFYFNAPAFSSSITTSTIPSGWVTVDAHDVSDQRVICLRDGVERVIFLPDGTAINIQADGSYEIKDDKAKVIYRANRVREFNRYLNASDLLEAFIRFCGREARVRKDEMLALPLRLFVAWLVLEAARADKEPEPDDIKLIPDLRKAATPRCRGCGAFIALTRHRAGIAFCSTDCFERAQERLAA